MFPVHKAVNLSVCPMSIDAIRSVKTSNTPKIRLSKEGAAPKGIFFKEIHSGA